MRPSYQPFFAFLASILSLTASLRAQPVRDVQESYFNQKVADSNPLRTEQARELDAYIKSMALDTTRFADLFQPNFASSQAFEQSAMPLRKAVATVLQIGAANRWGRWATSACSSSSVARR